MSEPNVIQSFGLSDPVEVHSAELLGGKGAGLVFMTANGIKVPPGFIIPTTFCKKYQANSTETMEEIKQLLPPYMQKLKDHFGYMPLVSVRSGAPISMPGMMDTILNVGLDSTTLSGWKKRLGGSCVTNCEGRLHEMYASVVNGVDRDKFLVEAMATSYPKAYTTLTGESFPNAQDQLIGAIEAVFKSWDNARAKVYRKLNNIPETLGTACVVQAMVFGNMGDTSCTGVLFTRNPDTGADEVVGEFLTNAQGEDVVAGLRTPELLSKMAGWNDEVAAALLDVAEHLEELKGDAQDIEFTVQDGVLYILQTRSAKRSAQAAMRIALDMIDEGADPKEMFRRVSKRQYALAQQPQLDPKFKQPPDYMGIGACTGVVTGKVVLTSEAAVEAKEPVILVTKETTPNDIEGMHAAVGILTMTGGSTSHAAVVARGMNKAAVVGLGSSVSQFEAGTVLSICGGTGRVWKGPVPTVGGMDAPLIREFEMAMVKACDATVMVDRIPTEALARRVIFDCSMWWMLPAEEILSNIKQLLSKFERVTLDFTNTTEDCEDFRGLVLPTGNPVELMGILQPASLVLPESDRARVVVLASHYVGKFKTVKTTSTLKGLINAEDKFVLTMEISPEVEKVLEWKRKDGMTPLVFGAVASSGRSFVSVPQLVGSLLAD